MAWVTLKASSKRVGDYEIVERLAKNDSGAVYKCRHTPTGLLVAIKTRAADSSANETALKRFEQEFKVASSLDHPNLVRAIDFGRDDTTLYLVMEFVEGESLHDRIERKGPMPEQEAIRIVTLVGQALHHAHQQGIIHRDVKPDNILIRADGQVKLTDLGLMKDVAEDQGLTRDATGLGTPNFMAPEQFTDAKHATIRCDIYSLAATLYTALTGKLPFAAHGPLSVLRKKLAGELTPMKEYVDSVSQQVDEAIRRALSADPEQRPATCLEFIQDLIPRKKQQQARRSSKVTATLARATRAGESERRAAVRFDCNQGTRCALEGSLHVESAMTADVWPATVQDVSASGLGLLLGRRFEIGTTLSVEIETPTRRKPKPRNVRVCRAEPRELGHWLLGCEFCEPLSNRELKSLV
jgi:serine/threonine protein kinase